MSLPRYPQEGAGNKSVFLANVDDATGLIPTVPRWHVLFAIALKMDYDLPR